MENVFEPEVNSSTLSSESYLYPGIQPQLAFSFRIPEYSTLRYNCTHSRSGILSFDAPQSCGGVIIFVK